MEATPPVSAAEGGQNKTKGKSGTQHSTVPSVNLRACAESKKVLPIPPFEIVYSARPHTLNRATLMAPQMLPAKKLRHAVLELLSAIADSPYSGRNSNKGGNKDRYSLRSKTKKITANLPHIGLNYEPPDALLLT